MENTNAQIMRQDYLTRLQELVNLPDNTMHNDEIAELYTEYCKFCFHHNLPTFDSNFDQSDYGLFVVDVDPIDYEIDENEKNMALLNLQAVLANRKQGMEDGIRMEDADLILKSVIQNARVAIATTSPNEDFFRSSLAGACGFSQAVTAYSLLSLGAQVTVNNISFFPDCDYRHAFATCTLPIKDGDKVEEKQFLLDATYRQFFTTLQCNLGRFYEGDPRFKDKCGPNCGYYLMKDKGRAFATELLSKGYVELTEYNAKAYGTGFSAEGICRVSTHDDVKRILGHSGKEYIDVINNEMLQEEIDYSRLDLQKECNIDLFQPIPTVKEATSSITPKNK